MASSYFVFTLLWLIQIAFCAIDSAKPTDCKWTDPKFSQLFNYHGLYLQNGGQLDYYTVLDDDVEEGQTKYYYYFNLCGKMWDNPVGSKYENYDHKYCPSTKQITSDGVTSCPDEDKVLIDGLTYAVQVDSTDPELSWALSNNDGNYKETTLIDGDDPSQGFKIRYYNGEWDDVCQRNREFTISLRCENDVSAIPKSTNVIETAKCKYELELETVHGCPSGCTSYANSLCAGQGLCGYDFSTNKSHCFCYYGYTGSSCEKVAVQAYGEWLMPKPERRTKDDSNSVHTFDFEIPQTDPITATEETRLVKVTYDLGEFHSSNDYYKIHDINNGGVVYYFNIVDHIAEKDLPDECKLVHASCKHVNNKDLCYTLWSNTTATKIGGYAFRWDNSSGTPSCALLGQGVEWQLYDTDDNPAHGVTLTYSDGSYDWQCETNNQIIIDLICPETRLEYEKAYNGATETEFSEEVKEISSCSYRLSYETALACPYNCITDVVKSKKGKKENEFSVCSGRGLCAADPIEEYVRCLCDDQWYGAECQDEKPSTTSSSTTTSTHSHTGYHVAIAIICILLVGVAIAVVYLFMRNKVLEKYAVPILDDHEQIEPRVPDYSDSDSEHMHNRPRVGGNRSKEMVTISKRSKKQKKQKHKRKGYSAQLNNDSDNDDDDDDNDFDDDDDDDDEQNGPSAYLAAGQDDSDTE